MPYYGGYGNGGWGFNDWGAGSTPAGSYLTGMANAIRAEGEYNLNTSAAAINLEEAQRRDIENRKLWTNTYFEMRRINESYTHPKRPPVPARDLGPPGPKCGARPGTQPFARSGQRSNHLA